MVIARIAVIAAVGCFIAAPALCQPAAPAETADVVSTPSADVSQLPAASPTQTTTATAPRKGGMFRMVGRDFKNFFSADSARTLSMFAIGAVAAAPWDREGVNNGFNIPTTLFESGNLMGQFAFQVSAGLATYGLSRVVGSRKAADAGRDIVRAQIVSQVLVQGLKHSIRRKRPDGSNRGAFPSGHASSAFATAGVLHRHYGWKIGAPAYALGSYVALARMAWNRHHATDVVMGAGLGLASARTVTLSMMNSRFDLGVQPTTGGAALTFSKIFP